MKRSSRPRTAAELSKSLNHQLNMYTLAAGGAGLGLFASAQPAEAKIVYTPAHVVIGTNQSYGIDFNHDGVSDVTIFNTSSHIYGASINIVRAFPSQLESAGVEGLSRETSWPGQRLERALKPGVRIGYGPRFYQKGVMAGQCIHGTNDPYGPCSYKPSNSAGRWANVKSRYLGVSFAFKARGDTQYGWARLSVRFSRKPFKAVVTLTGYAYETIPNKAIIAGTTKGPDVTTVYPARLGHLAAGASAIPAWRAKQTAATTH
jgi:hypothetical protein